MSFFSKWVGWLTLTFNRCILDTMEGMPIFSAPAWSVIDLTRFLRELLEGEPLLQDLWVKGEASNVARPASGHIYFTLKDREASLRCVIWRSAALRLQVLPRDGEALEVHGSLGIYEAGGNYQLYVDRVRPAGEGALFQAFLEVKARLEAEGLFTPERKREIPSYPRTIGIVTSASGAALQDMLNTLRRRYPLAEVILSPSLVQGEGAPLALIQALGRLNHLAHPDVILLARGGGSMEDLWAFNDEGLARAIADSAAPVITGIGHETDFTIADFVADLRAPTPTAAAVLATPDKAELQASLAEERRRLNRRILDRLGREQDGLRLLASQLRLYSPVYRVRSELQRLDEFSLRMATTLQHQMTLRRARLGGMAQRLAALNPQAVLQRGYAVVSGSDGRIIRSTDQVKGGDKINVQVSDGKFGAEVRPIRKEN